MLLVFIAKNVRIAREEVVGFYSSGPKVKENDLKVGVLYVYLSYIVFVFK